MSTPTSAPDIRAYTLLMLELVVPRLAPGLITPAGIDSLKSCSGSTFALTLVRVLSTAAIRAGLVSRAESDAIRAKASPHLDPVMAMVAVGQPSDPGNILSIEPADFIRDIDLAIASPAKRAELPEWFIDGMWPGILRRLASGEMPSRREIAIISQVLAGPEEEP